MPPTAAEVTREETLETRDSLTFQSLYDPKNLKDCEWVCEDGKAYSEFLALSLAKVVDGERRGAFFCPTESCTYEVIGRNCWASARYGLELMGVEDTMMTASLVWDGKRESLSGVVLWEGLHRLCSKLELGTGTELAMQSASEAVDDEKEDPCLLPLLSLCEAVMPGFALGISSLCCGPTSTLPQAETRACKLSLIPLGWPFGSPSTWDMEVEGGKREGWELGGGGGAAGGSSKASTSVW
uniref:Uncharacterized protein n=1 Tax=Chromera velia CCMP2878 TaxID=1169474 RepID=A0A0G4HUJ7_9ALVE|eukprot:Cvel_8660.t1-p1 / transcript=Cvel_8660.t1 / gene=Cvel_8660 / organism=Chromera_velia_CCMP2878 / gene_product=hypothetical protein / transcript_product=hypothetical protein / location=Cvel_scaffold483:25634-30162(-) / protein_length=239 / sequence_SO=supercontig / SO=protein_coding / is_pseudo=false